MEYLDKFLSTISDAERAQLLKVLQNDSGTSDLSSDELESYIADAISELGKIGSKPKMILRKQSNEIKSKELNDMLNEISTDLHALFNESAKIDLVIEDHKRLNSSVLSNIEKGIKKLSDIVTSYEILANNKDGYVQNFYETFRDTSSFESDIEEITGMMTASINNDLEVLTLPVLSNNNRIIDNQGNPLATIRIVKQVGEGFIEQANKTHDISSAIDGSDSTFWSSIILTDEPLNIPWYENGQLILSNGAACKFEIIFNSICPISEIVIKPFTEFPMEFLRIYSYENLNYDCVPVPIVDIDTKIISEGIVTLQFPELECQRLEFIINQPHYTPQSFLVSKKSKHNIELWHKVYGDTIDELNELWGKDASGKNAIIQERINKYWESFENELSLRLSNNNMHTASDYIEAARNAANKSIYRNDDNKVVVNKYEYIYGIYEIKISSKNYHSEGVYVTRPIKTTGNIKEISIDSNESHMYLQYDAKLKKLSLPSDSISNNFQATAVEWYISTSSNEWINVLSSNDIKDGLPFVACEVLKPSMVNEEILATTRFKIDTTNSIVIRRDGEVISDVEVIDDNAILINNFMQNSIYSISYYVKKELNYDPFKIDLESMEFNVKKVKEVFTNGTDRTNSIELKHYPYVDYGEIYNYGSNYNPNDSSIYQPIVITIKDGNNIITQSLDGENKLYNCTNYINQEREALQKYSDNHKRYDYRHDGQKIVFANSWPPGTQITVEYYSYIGDIRAKAVVRRAVPGFMSISPAISDYLIKFKAINKI